MSDHEHAGGLVRDYSGYTLSELATMVNSLWQDFAEVPIRLLFRAHRPEDQRAGRGKRPKAGQSK